MLDQRRQMENTMTSNMAGYKADMEQQMGQQLAKQMSEMRAFMQAALASKDTELANAKVAINAAKAESRDAAGQVNAETAAAKSWQNKADEAHRTLTELQAQRA